MCCIEQKYAHNMLWNQVEKMLKKIRKEKGLSWERLSKASGVPVSTIANWERGNIGKARLESVKKVADALGCKVDDLI